MAICLERSADLHVAQLMPLPLTVSCFSKIQIGFTFLVAAHPGSSGKRAVKRACVCVCVLLIQADMEKYCAEHPEFQPRVVKTFLSKAEQRIKDKVDGKPEKPPRYLTVL